MGWAEPELPERDPQRRVIAVINGKGGVGKTSTACAIAGELALTGGFRVLLADFDPVGGVARELGLTARGLSDNGAGLHDALVKEDRDLTSVVVNARPNLDLICGGLKLRNLGLYAGARTSATDIEWLATAGAKIAAMANDYDFVLIDTPPGDVTLQQIALVAARWLIVPVKTDVGSWDGLAGLGSLVRGVRRVYNDELAYLGSVIFANPTTATNLLSSTQQQLGTDIQELLPLFTTVIRSSASATYARNRGQLPRELVADAKRQDNEMVAWLRRSRKDPDAVKPTKQDTGSVKAAEALAGDYRALTTEILTRLNAYEIAAEAVR